MFNYDFPRATIPVAPTAGDWPDVGAAIIEDVANMSFQPQDADDKGHAGTRVVLTHRRRLKILAPSGISAAHIILPMDAYSTITRLAGRSLSPSGEAVMLDGKGAMMKPVAQTTDIQNLEFTVPGAQVGGLVEYYYERVYTDPLLVPPWVFGDGYPTVRAVLSIEVGGDTKIDFRYFVGETPSDRPPLQRTFDGEEERLVFVETNLPPVFREPDMWHVTHAVPWIAFAVRPGPGVAATGSALATWDDVTAEMKKRFDAVHAPAGQGSVEARFRALRDNLRPLDLPGLGVRPPTAAADLLHGAPACSRDVTALLLASLASASVVAYPALIATPQSPPLIVDFPALYPFMRAVVAVQVDDALLHDAACSLEPASRGPWCDLKAGSFLFMDPTCKLCRWGEIDTALTGGRALILMPDGVRWVDVPLDPPDNNLVRGTVQLALDVDGSLRGNWDGTVRGVQARALRAAVRRDGVSVDPAVLQDAVGLGVPSAQVHLAKLGNPDVPLQIHLDLKGRAEREDFERFKLRVVDVVGRSFPAACRRGRRFAAVLDSPRWNDVSAVITLPVGYEAKLSPSTKLANEFAEYASGFALKDGALRYARRLVMKTHVIPPGKWSKFCDFVDQVNEVESTGPSVLAGE